MTLMSSCCLVSLMPPHKPQTFCTSRFLQKATNVCTTTGRHTLYCDSIFS